MRFVGKVQVGKFAKPLPRHAVVGTGSLLWSGEVADGVKFSVPTNVGTPLEVVTTNPFEPLAVPLRSCICRLLKRRTDSQVAAPVVKGITVAVIDLHSFRVSQQESVQIGGFVVHPCSHVPPFPITVDVPSVCQKDRDVGGVKDCRYSVPEANDACTVWLRFDDIEVMIRFSHGLHLRCGLG
jgi:hypothetical protein